MTKNEMDNVYNEQAHSRLSNMLYSRLGYILDVKMEMYLYFRIVRQLKKDLKYV